MKTHREISGKSGRAKQPNTLHRRKRQNISDISDMDARITIQAQLLQLRTWVIALNEKHSYRWIAAKTSRGLGSHGYWQSVADGKHLLKRPLIRPRLQDWYDLNLIYRVVRDYDAQDHCMYDAAMQVVEARARLDGTLADLLALVRKRTGRKQ